jgi:oligoribonuclease NrnB/cAMP/cGMP phosphodiesterase (DHH superfamily)
MKNVICIYHKNCNDGFGAALAVKTWGDTKGEGCNIEFIPAHHGDQAPNVDGKDVLIVDFAYPRDILLEMHEAANSLVVIDHHKTAEENLRGLDFCVFDMDKSGAVLTWEHLFPNKQTPLLLLYIQDRDIWQFNLEHSKEISSALSLLEKDFDVWGKYLNDDLSELITKGAVILEYQENQVQKIVKSNDIPLEYIAGYLVPCINTTALISDIGHELAQGHPFAAMYFEKATDRIYSLRSAKDGIDVSKIAEKFGGGGHYHAASFKGDKPKITGISGDPEKPKSK